MATAANRKCVSPFRSLCRERAPRSLSVPNRYAGQSQFGALLTLMVRWT